MRRLKPTGDATYSIGSENGELVIDIIGGRWPYLWVGLKVEGGNPHCIGIFSGNKGMRNLRDALTANLRGKP